ncbi:hypothetical protein MASR1M90_18010 [Desulfovibrionales bacterium]
MFATFRKLLLLILGVPFVLLGISYLVDGSTILWTYWQSGHWVQTQALIAEVSEITHADQLWGSQTLVVYDYSANGELYSGTRICPFPDCPDQEIYATLRTAHETGGSVTVWVNPTAPERALLFRHMHVGHLLLVWSIGLFCLFTGGSATAFGIYMLRAQSARPGEKTS